MLLTRAVASGNRMAMESQQGAARAGGDVRSKEGEVSITNARTMGSSYIGKGAAGESKEQSKEAGESKEEATRKDYSILDFVAFHLLDVSNEKGLDEALLEYCDFMFLNGEDCNYGFAERWKGGAKWHPPQVRVPMLEFLKSAVSGIMLAYGYKEMALYNETSFSTYARPGELLKMKAVDYVPANRAYHYAVLVVAPMERGVGTKAGVYDETLILDDTRVPWLSKILGLHADARLKKDEAANLWPFTAAEYLRIWRRCVKSLGIGEVATSPYQNRHGGASRDHLLKLRSVQAIQRRGRWAVDASARIYDKPGRLQQIINRFSSKWEIFGENVREHFPRYFHTGTCPLPVELRRSWEKASQEKRNSDAELFGKPHLGHKDFQKVQGANNMCFGADPRVQLVHADLCQFGTQWRK
ncbi:unnamed protein product, partial [Symbiodinium sp. KB8]